ncbi:MAG: hypothetical protein ACNA8K_17500 [Cyclonatronaceae bacterium]
MTIESIIHRPDKPKSRSLPLDWMRQRPLNTFDTGQRHSVTGNIGMICPCSEMHHNWNGWGNPPIANRVIIRVQGT